MGQNPFYGTESLTNFAMLLWTISKLFRAEEDLPEFGPKINFSFLGKWNEGFWLRLTIAIDSPQFFLTLPNSPEFIGWLIQENQSKIIVEDQLIPIIAKYIAI